MRQMTDVTLQAARLRKVYGSRTAVDDLSFETRRGDVVGLLGPNGAGKTTTIRLLTTILPRTSGHFSVAGIPDSRPPEIRRRVGVLPESAGYPGHQTGAAYLRYHARLSGLDRSETERTTRRLLGEVGLADRASSRISTYSRGMRQRLGLARALVNSPTVIFLDEPTLGLDPAGQRQVLDLVGDVAANRGATVVLSTHALADVERVCTHVLIINGGRLLAAGSPAEVARAVAAPPSGLLRVSAGQLARATAALSGPPAVGLDVTTAGRDTLRISAATGGRDSPGTGPDLNAALRAVLDAGVPVLSFEVAGARLSDAFLTMTASTR
jgi:ABC-2 type transport system ATP-binding protein